MTYIPLGTGTEDDIIKINKNEFDALKTKCDTLEKAVKVLQTICEAHGRTLESWRRHILINQQNQGDVDPTWNGEEFELMQ
jgi:hypothetical protein